VNVVWTWNAWNDYASWQASDPERAEKINALIKDIARNPFNGLGKPEPLKGEFSGFWSRRINSEHRLIYSVSGKNEDKRLEIVQCREHYAKR
jgi:toxin YoeB